MKAATYLEFKHNAREVIQTYESIFEAEIVCQYDFTADMTQNQELVGKIFHAELKIGDLNLYLSDSGVAPDFSSIKFVVEFRDEEGAHQCFEKLVQHGKAIRDFEKMPFGPTIAQAKDKFGIKWEVVIC